MAILPSGVNGKEIHVAQRGTYCDPVVVFDENGNVLRTWGATNVTSVHGLSAHVNTLFLTDILQGTVKEFDPLGNLIRMAGTPGNHSNGLSPAQFSAPADVTFTADNTIVISDGDGGTNNRVLAMSPNDFATVIYGIGGGNTTAPGEFSSPHSVTYDLKTNTILVADRGHNRIQLFDATSAIWLGEWETGPCFTTPWAVRIDTNTRRVFIADGDHGLFTIMDITGAIESIRTNQQLTALNCNLLQNFTIGIPEKPHLLGFDNVTQAIYLAGVGTIPTIQRYILN